MPHLHHGNAASGSTFLHELLLTSRDPANWAPVFWEVMFPLPKCLKLADRGGVAWRIWKAEMNLWWFLAVRAPADLLVQCERIRMHRVAIHSYTLFSQEFVSIFHKFPLYEVWLDTVGMLPAYARQSPFRNISASLAGKQWVVEIARLGVRSPHRTLSGPFLMIKCTQPPEAPTLPST